MKLGQKGNQVSLIILHECPGHMIKVKGHLGSINLDHGQVFLKYHHNFKKYKGLFHETWTKGYSSIADNLA